MAKVHVTKSKIFEKGGDTKLQNVSGKNWLGIKGTGKYRKIKNKEDKLLKKYFPRISLHVRLLKPRKALYVKIQTNTKEGKYRSENSLVF